MFYIRLCVLFVIAVLAASEDGKLKKCYFGDPLEWEDCFRTKACPKSHVCVRRSDQFLKPPQSWIGCCERGNGTCHEQWQKLDLNALDAIAPQCNLDGSCEPEQCMWPSCFCVLPEDCSIIKKTITSFGPARFRRNCTEIVAKILKGMTTKKTKITTPEETEKPTTTPVKTKKPEKIKIKCARGKPIQQNNCVVDDDCPTGYECTKGTTKKGISWTVCCLSDSRTCPNAAQSVSYKPKCDTDGFFRPKQCTKNGCFCTFPNGTKIEGNFGHNVSANKCKKLIEEDGDANCIDKIGGKMRNVT